MHCPLERPLKGVAAGSGIANTKNYNYLLQRLSVAVQRGQCKPPVMSILPSFLADLGHELSAGGSRDLDHAARRLNTPDASMATWGDNQTWIESLDIILSVSFSPSKISFSSSPNSYQVLSAGTLVLGYWSMRENCAPELANSIGKGYFCIIKNHHSTDQLDYHKCIFTYYSCLPSQKAWWPGPGSNIALLADCVTSVYLGRSV